MENLIIQATPRTLQVNTNYDKGLLTFQGNSYSEDTMEFFQPIIEWLNKYTNRPKPYTEVYFTLDYVSTSSVKFILELLQILEKIHLERLSKVDIYWNYHEFDENTEELGQDYKNMLKVPVHLVKKSSLNDAKKDV